MWLINNKFYHTCFVTSLLIGRHGVLCLINNKFYHACFVISFLVGRRGVILWLINNKFYRTWFVTSLLIGRHGVMWLINNKNTVTNLNVLMWYVNNLLSQGLHVTVYKKKCQVSRTGILVTVKFSFMSCAPL